MLSDFEVEWLFVERPELGFSALLKERNNLRAENEQLRAALVGTAALLESMAATIRAREERVRDA